MREKADLIDSLYRRGLLPEGSTLDDILRMNVEHVLARRLQSQVYYKGLASSPKQARQLLIHGHIAIGDQIMTVPGYVLTRDEEATLQYSPSSPLADAGHSLREEIENIRSAASYGEEGEELETREGVPTAEEVAEISEAAEAAPSAEDTSEGGDE